MNTALEQALQTVELEAGRTYRVQVRGRLIEVRVLDGAGPLEVPSPLDEGMIEPWVELPEPKWTGILPAKLAPPDPPDAPDIPKDEAGQ